MSTQAASQNVAFFTPSEGGTAPANVAGSSFNCTGQCPASTVAGSTGDDSASTVTLATAANGNDTLALNISAGGATLQHTFNLGVNGANLTALGAGWAGFYDVNDGLDSSGNSFDLKVAGSAQSTSVLQYTTLGLWTETNTAATAPGGYGVFTAGNETTPAAMAAIPANTTANYSSSFVIGQGSLNGSAYNLSGTVAATATFGGASPGVSGTIAANVFGGPVSGYWNTLRFTSAIAGGTSHFSGTITAPAVTAGVSDASGNTPSITTTAMTGPLAGSFYGNLTSPGAGAVTTPAEIGAVFNLSGGGNTMLGAFGGHK